MKRIVVAGLCCPVVGGGFGAAAARADAPSPAGTAAKDGGSFGSFFKLSREPVAAVCNVAADASERKTIAVELPPGASAADACPEGSAYAGFRMGVDVPTVWGAPAPLSAPEQQRTGEGK